MSNESIFLPQEFIRRKRDGLDLSVSDINRFVAGITDSSVTDAQISSFAMAVFFNGMSADEGAALTLAMRSSGDVINWCDHGFDADAPITDKHSTGGVGDKVSIMLAPIVAACGAYVPMVSGRGLGHTGGTLDKLQAIPDYDALPDIETFAATVKDVGCSIIGQTGSLAPADRKFYSIRDVTATVESVPLITASILSKKLAAGLGSLVMDVKFGSGAFMNDINEARELAENIVRVAGTAGVPTTALLTDMNQVLGRTAGHAVEMLEVVDFLTSPSDAEPRLVQVTLALAGHMLLLSGLYGDFTSAFNAAKNALDDGRAASVFAKMVAVQGGPRDLIEKPHDYLKLAGESLPVFANGSGNLSQTDTRAIGNAIIILGGGRTNPNDKIDMAVGLSAVQPVGTNLDAHTPFCMVHARDADTAKAAALMIQNALTTSQETVSPTPITVETIQADGKG